jgi:hypothetical protein
MRSLNACATCSEIMPGRAALRAPSVSLTGSYPDAAPFDIVLEL